MKILVVAATRQELSGLYSSFGLPDKNFVQTPKFDVLITGVGMTATAFSMGQHLSNVYHVVVNLGIAGCYDRNIPLGSLLNIITDNFSELGAEDKEAFITIDNLGFGRSSYSPIRPTLTTDIISLKQVNGITVNKVHGNKTSIATITRRLNPTTESMEGAAVFYSCEQLNIACLQVRSISNYVEERNKDNWKIGLAVKTLNDWAIQFLTNS